MYKRLSYQLYRKIDKHYLANNIYDPYLLQKFGRVPKAYVGLGECHRTSLLIKYCLPFPKVGLYLSTKDQLFIEHTRLPVYNHVFLKTDDLIIDPTYKQLFFWPIGDINKWDSPYAEYLQNLDPVFIGTNDQLETLINQLKERRDMDSYHKNDIWIVDWYETAKFIE